MSRFCTQRGTSNEDGDGFCENCGVPLKAKMPSSGTSAAPPSKQGPANDELHVEFQLRYGAN